MANTHTIKITLEVEYDATATTWEEVLVVLNATNTILDDAEIVDYDYTEAKPIQHEPPDDTHNDF